MGGDWSADTHDDHRTAAGHRAAPATGNGVAAGPLHRVAEPCTLRSAGGRVRDGLVRGLAVTSPRHIRSDPSAAGSRPGPVRST